MVSGRGVPVIVFSGPSPIHIKIVGVPCVVTPIHWPSVPEKPHASFDVDAGVAGVEIVHRLVIILENLLKRDLSGRSLIQCVRAGGQGQRQNTSCNNIEFIFIFIVSLEVNIKSKTDILGDRITIRVILLRIKMGHTKIIPYEQVLAADIDADTVDSRA